MTKKKIIGIVLIVIIIIVFGVYMLKGKKSTETETIENDADTAQRLLNLLPKEDIHWVNAIAMDYFKGTKESEGLTLDLVLGQRTMTESVFKAYMRVAPNSLGKFVYKWGDQNQKLLWPESTTKEFWIIYNNFIANAKLKK